MGTCGIELKRGTCKTSASYMYYHSNPKKEEHLCTGNQK